MNNATGERRPPRQVAGPAGEDQDDSAHEPARGHLAPQRNPSVATLFHP